MPIAALIRSTRTVDDRRGDAAHAGHPLAAIDREPVLANLCEVVDEFAPLAIDIGVNSLIEAAIESMNSLDWKRQHRLAGGRAVEQQRSADRRLDPHRQLVSTCSMQIP